MKKLLSILSSIVAFVVAYVVVQYGIQQYRDYRGAQAVTNMYQELEQAAAEKSPEDIGKSEAMRLAAIDKTKEQLAKSQSDQERKVTAASQFWGFLWMNTRMRRDYCNGFGVNIDAFVSKFSTAHKLEYEQAKTIYKNAGINEENLWPSLNKGFAQAIIVDMKDFQEGAQVSTPTEACQLIAENADYLAAILHLSERMPDVHKALMRHASR